VSAEVVAYQAELLEECSERKERQDKRSAVFKEEQAWSKAAELPSRRTFTPVRSSEPSAARAQRSVNTNKFAALIGDDDEHSGRAYSKKLMLEREFAERGKRDGRYALIGDDDDEDLQVVDDASTVSESGVHKSKKSVHASKKKLPLALRMTRAQLRKVHRVGHAGATRMFDFLMKTKGMREVTTTQTEQLMKKIKLVIAACDGCRAMAPRARRVTRIPRVVEWLQRGWCDFMKLADGLWAMVIIDESSAEIALALVEENEGEGAGAAAYRTYFLAWGSKKGHFVELLSDVGGELISAAFLKEAEQAKMNKFVTPAASSESHGRVERVIETVRWSIDRMRANSKTKSWTRDQWKMALAIAENAYRNEILTDGWSSSQRATGRSSSVAQTLLSDSRGSGDCEPSELQQVMDVSLEAYRDTIADRRLRRMLVTRRADAQRGQKDRVPVQCGDLVAYLRKSKKDRLDHWHGPGRVVGAYEDEDGQPSHMVQVDHGGVLLRMHRDDVLHWEDTGTLVKQMDQMDEADRAEKDAEDAQAEKTAEDASPEKDAMMVGKNVDGRCWCTACDLATCTGGVEGQACLVGTLPAGHAGAYAGEPDTAHEKARCGKTVTDMPQGAYDEETGEYDAGPDHRWCQTCRNGLCRDWTQYRKYAKLWCVCQGRGCCTKCTTRKPSTKANNWRFQGTIPYRTHKTQEEALEFVPRLEEEAGKKEEEALAEEKCPACRQKRLGKPVKKAHDGCKYQQRGMMGVPGTVHAAPEEAAMAAMFSLFEDDDDDRRSTYDDDDDDDAETTVGWTADGRYRHEMCLFADDSDFERLSSLDVYRYDWDDLDPEVQWAAFEKGLLDYDSTGSWLRGSDMSFKELRAAGKTVMSGRWVTKAKVDADGRLIGKARWTPRGYEETGLDKHETDSPTANRLTHRIGEVYGRSRQWPGFKADISAAFFSSDEFEDGEQKWVEVPKEDPDHPGGKARVARQLLREVPGTKKAPQRWWLTFKSWALGLGLVQSKVDPCMLWIPGGLAGHDDAEVDGAYAGYLACHVDDFKGRATPAVVKWLKKQLHERFEVSVWLEDPPVTDFLGERWAEDDEATVVDQDEYITEKLKEIKLTHGRWKQRDAAATDEELHDFRSSLGGLSWVSTRTHGDVSYETSRAAGAVNQLKVKDLVRLNKVIRFIQRRDSRYKVRLPVLSSTKFKVTVVVDAGEGEADPEVWSRAQGGYILGIQDCELAPGEPGWFAPIAWRSGKLRRVTHSSFDAETIAAIEALDAALMVAMLIEEGVNGVRESLRDRTERWLDGDVNAFKTTKTMIELHTDSKSLTSRIQSMSTSSLTKRRKADIADLRECVDRGELQLLHIAGKQNPADCLTKHRSRTKQTTTRFIELIKTGWYEPVQT